MKDTINLLKKIDELFASGMVTLNDATPEDKKQFTQLKKEIKLNIKELKDITKVHNENIDTLYQSCEEALDGTWDKSDNGFEAMQVLLERCKI